MSHRWNCPSRYEAERQGERAFGYGSSRYSNPYERDRFSENYCREARRSWDDGYRQAERQHEDELIARRQAERRHEEAQWAAMEEDAWLRRREEEVAYQAWCDEQMAIAESEHYFWMEQDILLDNCETV